MSIPSALAALVAVVVILSTATYGNETADGCEAVGSMQLCWGHKTLPRDPTAPHTAAFVFVFVKEFASAPVVTNAINVDGSGHGMTVYTWRLDGREYRGRLNNMYIAVPVNGTITMSYMAIGRPKK